MKKWVPLGSYGDPISKSIKSYEKRKRNFMGDTGSAIGR